MKRKRKPAPPKLTEREWSLVFSLRCRTKRGEQLSDAERAMVVRAFREDPDRYKAMSDDVFAATKPFGAR